MKTNILLTTILILLSKIIFAQQAVTGYIFDEKTQPIPYATLALLEPTDSTLKFFGITDVNGFYQIKNVSKGNYLLQASYLGYKTLYKVLNIDGNIKQEYNLVLKQKSKVLSDVTIEADRIPIKFNKDTVEYDAAAYKNKPDAVAEDLLKKLPGVEVDRAGNIKAMGENVNNVLVDGKEFFSNDPKVATKNLPADAIKKVQVYDQKTEEEKISGMTDGERDKTINIVLKDDKKKAYFGDVQAGGGTNERFQTSAKLYKFGSKTQFAALGMANNINQFGFSFEDYLSFSGGLRSFGEGGININTNNSSSPPINFGQQVNGLLSSAALGLNYSREYAKDKRFNISYMANGLDRNLTENIYSKNFINANEFERNATNNTSALNYSQSVNLSWRNKIDSTQSITANSTLQFNNATNNQQNYSNNSNANTIINDLLSIVKTETEDVNANIRSNYVRKLSNNWKSFRVNAEYSYTNSLNNTNWNNKSTLYQNNFTFVELRDQSLRNKQLKQNYSIGATRTIKGNFYVEPSMAFNSTTETISRTQNDLKLNDQEIDSLSPDFTRSYNAYRPALNLKYNTDALQIDLSLKYEFAELHTQLNDSSKSKRTFIYALPLFEIEYEYQKGRRLMLQANTRINSPSANQLLPVVNNSNSTLFTKGNSLLKPEYQTNVRLNWILFDEFSFISFFNSINLTHTKDKINWNRTIDSNLVQYLETANVANDYNLRASSEFSSPIRKLKININLELAENWNRGISFINNIENISNTYTHEITARIDNRKKEKWDVSIGSTISFSNAFYSVQSELNNTYTNQAYFIDANYRPNDKWYIGFNADINNYSSQSFNESVSIPLLKMEITRYVFKNNRGSIGLSIFDILNKNTGVQRIADQNAIQETRSNIIGRYGMISFKYKLNKFGEKSSGLKVDIRG